MNIKELLTIKKFWNFCCCLHQVVSGYFIITIVTPHIRSVLKAFHMNFYLYSRTVAYHFQIAEKGLGTMW